MFCFCNTRCCGVLLFVHFCRLASEERHAVVIAGAANSTRGRNGCAIGCGGCHAGLELPELFDEGPAGDDELMRFALCYNLLQVGAEPACS
jgi:hypothetical protein